jgi:hypothetical protein
VKVLFLDIDGVLNNESTKERVGVGIFAGMVGLDARLVKLFLDWHANHPEIQVVLSSTWRLDDRMHALVRDAIGCGMVTPNMGSRRKEIDFVLDWLKPTHYAILDDIAQFSAEQQPHFVQTSYVHGLRERNLRKIEEILGIEAKEKANGPHI